MIDFLRNLLLRDFWLKLFSLALAILIWLTVSFAIRNDVQPSGPLASSNSERTGVYSDIPVLVTGAGSGADQFRIRPKRVEVTVRADSKTLQQLDPSRIHAVVDLSDFDPSQGLQANIEVAVPPGVTLLHVVPNQVSVLVPSGNGGTPPP